jgi:hypothetical protein
LDDKELADGLAIIREADIAADPAAAWDAL